MQRRGGHLPDRWWGGAAYRVRSGHVFIVREGAKESLEKTGLVPGDIFDHVALLTGGDHAETALADEEVVLDVIGGKDVGATLAHQPDAASSLLDASFHQSSMAGDVSPDNAEIPTTLRLRAMEPDIAGQFGDAGLKTDRLPFMVGPVFNGHEIKTPPTSTWGWRISALSICRGAISPSRPMSRPADP